jgi:hypothetical protein
MAKRQVNRSVSTERLIADLKALAQETESLADKEWEKRGSALEQRLRERLKERGKLLTERTFIDHLSDTTSSQSDSHLVPKIVSVINGWLAEWRRYPSACLTASGYRTPRKPFKRERDDGLFSMRVVEKENQDLVVSFDSQEPKLEGMTVRVFLEGSSWHRDVRLQPEPGEQVSAQIVIKAQERKNLPENAVLRPMIVMDEPTPKHSTRKRR